MKRSVEDVQGEGDASRQRCTHNRTLLLGGVEVAQIAIGTLPMGVTYPDPHLRPSKTECLEIFRRASLLSPHVPTLFDTCDFYCDEPADKGYMEKMLAEALAGKDLADADASSSSSAETASATTATATERPPQGLIATKGGMSRIGNTSRDWRVIADAPDFCPQACMRDSALRLGTQMFLWQLHHCAKKTDIGSIMGAVKQLCDDTAASAGRSIADNVGLCNASLDQIVEARRHCPRIVSVQNNFSLWLGPKALSDQMEVIKYCEREGLVYIAYGIFGGLKARRDEVSLARDFDPALATLAKQKGVSPHGLLLGWLINRWPKTVMPLVGMRSSRRLEAVEEAYGLVLTPEEMQVVANVKKLGAKKSG